MWDISHIYKNEYTALINAYIASRKRQMYSRPIFLKKTPGYAEEVTPCAVVSMLWYWYFSTGGYKRLAARV